MTSNASNLYSHVVVKPSVPPPNNGTKAMHATVSTATGANIIKQNFENRHSHNALVRGASGFKVQGGSKSKSKSKRSKRSSSKRSKRSSSKRSSSKRHKRGGAPTPTPSSTPKPTPTSTPKPSVVPVPQFANASASANSVSINHGLMNAGAQAVYDDPNGPVSTMKIQ